MPATAAARSALRQTVGGLPRAYWWLWTSTLINRLGGFVVPFLALYLTADRGYSAGYAGLVAALFGLGGAVAAVAGGVLADRIGRRPTLLAAQLGTAASTLWLGFADGRTTIAAVAFLVGLTSSAGRPATSAIMADVVSAADRVRAFSLNYWAINIGFGVSAAVAGVVAAHGYLTLFVLDAASTLLCAVVVFAKVPETRPEAADAGIGAEGDAPAVGLGAVLRDLRFMAVVGLAFLLALIYQQCNSTLPVSMGGDHISSSLYGLVAGLNGLLVVLLQIPLTRLFSGYGKGGLLCAAALVTGWGFGLAAFAHSAWGYAASVSVWTVGEILNAPTSMAVTAELSPEHARGRYQGMNNLAWSAAAFAGPLGGGLLLEHLGSRGLWFACAGLGTLIAGGYLLLAPRLPGPADGPARWRKASRLRVDSPRLVRHSHSRRIAEAKPSSRRVLKGSSAFSRTTPSSRSTSSSVTEESGSRPVR
jgi:MFS family permease